MERQERRDFWLAWNLLPYLGKRAGAAARRLFGADPVPAGAPEGNTPAGWLDGLIRRFRELQLEAAIAREWQEAERIGCRVITLADAGYPLLLREIPDPPPILYMLGEPVESDDRAIAVVGARRATHYGLRAARWIAGDLAAAGLTVVSGLARGIDTAAHRAALETGGRTIAVLGSGLIRPYPPENRALCTEIARQGVVLSPFPLEARPLGAHFPQRNRILSGLALGTVVIEAAERSGSLITARLALEQGREVFAVPGRITAPESIGANFLIKAAGAKLVQSAADVVEELRPEVQARLRPIGAGGPIRAVEEVSAVERQVLAALSAEEGIHIDTLLEQVPIGAARLLETLLSLEMNQRVVHLPGQHYILQV